MIPLLEKLVSIFLIGTALIITLKHFNYDILSLVTALGIGSLAIGLAAKDTLANMISGFTLMIDRPFRIGDRIQLAEGSGGRVDIGLAEHEDQDGRQHLPDNPQLGVVQLHSGKLAFPDVRWQRAGQRRRCLRQRCGRGEAASCRRSLDVPEVLSDPAPEAFFVSFGDSALNLSLFFWVEDYTQVFSVTDQINMR